MKKLIKLLCISSLFFLSHSASAQADLDKGNWLLNAGLGFGYYYAGGVPFVVSADIAINDVITVGPYLGYTSYRYRWAGYRSSYTFIDFGVRGAYHFSKHINMSTDKLDLYGGLMLGYRASSYKYDGPSGWAYSDPYGSSAVAGLFAGARYYFTDSFAGFGELGYGLAPLSLGVTFKF